jgi:hypothetical protein
MPAGMIEDQLHAAISIASCIRLLRFSAIPGTAGNITLLILSWLINIVVPSAMPGQGEE